MNAFNVRENINPNVEFDEVFNEMIDCLSSYSTPTAMMDEAVRMHYEAEDNLTQNDFEKQQQAMIDRAEKREEDRIQDEKIKENALSEEEYERMQQGFDEQRTRPKQSDTVSDGNKRKPDSRTTDGGRSTDDGRRSEETSQRAGSANAEGNNEEIKSKIDNQGNPIDENGKLVLYHRVPNVTAEIISEDERVLVDALVDMLGEAIGSENVITNEAEAKRLIDEANGEDVKYSSDKERQDLTTTIHPSSEHGAKLQINLKTAKENLKNLTDFYKGIKNSRGFIKAITTALGGNKTDTQSHYFEFNAKNGDIITLRVSNHNTNSEHYNDNEQVVSIVVKSRRHPNTFIGNANADVKEYVYFKENIKDDTLSLIAESVRDLLETGEYKDKTGIAVVNEFSRKSNNLKLHKVYHGSGADFEAFDHSHMGEGEGNQAYGWGTYVTEAEGIGRTYADTVLNRDNPHKDVKYIGDNPKYADEIAPLFKNGVRTYEEVKDFIAKSSNPRKDEHLQWFLSTRPEQWQSPNAGKRHLYTVEIPKDNGKNYLAWDGYVSNEQYPMWYEAMKILGEQDGFAKPEEILPFKEGHTRVSIEHEVKYLEHKHTPKAVSEALHKAGFTGIKYPAQYRSGGREDGAKNYVIFNEKDLKITDKVQFFKTKDGEVFGFTVGGKIYIDTERVKADTPLHEYTHLWAEALRKVNPKAWEQLKKEMLKQTELMDYVKSNYPEIENEDALIEEVFAHYSGTQGRKRLLEEMNKEKDKQDRAIDKIKVINMFNKLKGLLDRFWNMTKDLFAGKVAGIERMTAEDFANMSLSSFLNKFNAVKVLQEATAKNTKRFGQEKEDTEIRYHISKKNNAEIERLLKKNANITDKEIEAFKQYVEHEQPVAQLSMAKWVGNGSVRLPEDKPTVDEALKICRKDKLDPMRYAAPGEIVKEWREKNIDEQEEQRQYLSPDSYPDVLTNKQDLGNGVTVYDVADTRAGQQAVRDLMNDHLTVDGRYYNCWCLLYASESTGELTSQAWTYWNNYNGTQKKVAFKDGKIVSFCASSSSHSEWWDLSDKSHGDKIPVEGKIPNDKLGRSSLMEVDMQTGKATPVGRKYSGNKKNGLYREWNKDDVLVLSENYKGGKRNGLCEYWYSNGQMMMRSNFKGGRYDGEYEYWYSNGQMMERSNYKDGGLNGLYEYWETNGQIMKRSNYKDGKRIENLPITEDKGAPAPRWEDENERIKEDRSVKNIKYHFGKKNKLKINKKDENKIGVALYVVNKEAKRCRDLSRWMYEDRKPYPGAIKILQQLGDIGEEIEIDEYGQPFLEDEYSERFYSEEGLRETIMELQNEIDEAETKLEEEEDLSDIEKEELQETIDFNQDYIDTYSKYEDDLGSVSNVFYLIKKMKIRKIDLYNLKEQIIENLDDSYIIGRHKFPNGDVRYLYKIGDFTFHGKDIQDELSDEYDKIEEIDEISAENKLEDEKKISIVEAEKILNDFIAKNITESESGRKGMLGVVLDALREAIGKENVITDNRQAQRVIDEQNGRVRPERVAEESKERAERVKNDLDLRRELKEITGAEGYGTNTAYVRGTSQDGTTYEVRVGNHIANFENFDRNNEELPQKIVSVVVMDEKFDKKNARYKSSEEINRELEEKNIDSEFQQIIIDDVKNKSQEEIQQAIEDVLFGMQVLKERGRLLFDSESAISYSRVQKRKYLSNRIEDIFNDVIKGKLKGQPVRIGNLSQEGKRYLEEISGLKLKENCHFVLNPSDLQHIYNNHFGDNEKDKGNNVPLTMHDIKRIADVISFPTEIVYGKDTDGLNKFFFLMESPNGTYNLLEIYANRNGNLTAKSYYKTKKSVSQRVISLRNSLHSTSSTDGATLSSAKIPQIFELPNENNLKLHKVYHGSGADFEAFDHSHMGEGEGNQSYGWGTYVTEVEGIGRTYAGAAAGLKGISYKGMTGEEVYDRADESPELDAASSVINSLLKGMDVESAINEAFKHHSKMGENELAEEIKKLNPNDFAVISDRILYTVEIPDDNGKNYLHYDKADVKTNEKVKQELITKLLQTEEYKGHEKELKQELSAINENTTGRGLYGTLQSYLGDKEASEFLSSLGFIGLSYPAQYRSGGREDGAKNYVIFNEKDLKITDKVQFFKTKDGEVFGFTVGGKVYVDERIADASTPIHEYTHLWAEPWGQRTCYVADPDGNLIEISSFSETNG